MPSGKVSQHVIEALESWEARAKVSQHVVEVLQAYTPPTVPAAISAASVAVGALGDECNSNPQDAAWNLRNIASVTGDGTKYSIYFDARGDAMTRAFTDTGQDFEIIAHVVGLGDGGSGMIGPCALDVNGTGMSASRHNDNSSYLWGVTTWAYNGTNTNGGATATLANHWIGLRRRGFCWSMRWSNDGTAWSVWAGERFDNRVITQIGFMRSWDGGAAQTVSLERFVYGNGGVDLTNFAGGGMVSQDVVEVLIAPIAKAVVSQHVIEVLINGAGTVPQIDAGVRVYGYAS